MVWDDDGLLLSRVCRVALPQWVLLLRGKMRTVMCPSDGSEGLYYINSTLLITCSSLPCFHTYLDVYVCQQLGCLISYTNYHHNSHTHSDVNFLEVLLTLISSFVHLSTSFLIHSIYLYLKIFLTQWANFLSESLDLIASLFEFRFAVGWLKFLKITHYGKPYNRHTFIAVIFISKVRGWICHWAYWHFYFQTRGKGHAYCNNDYINGNILQTPSKSSTQPVTFTDIFCKWWLLHSTFTSWV